MATNRSPTLAELVSRAIDVRLDDVHVALPAVVESFDASAQTVDVQPLIQRTLRHEDGTEEDVRLPKLVNVPVVFPRGGGCFMSFPLAKGDNVLVVFCDRALGEWFVRGGEIPVSDMRTHTFSGAVAYPGLYDKTKAISGVSTSKVVVGKSGQAAKDAARKGDGAGGGTLAVVFAPGTGGATLSMTYTPGDGSAPQNISGVGGTLNIKEQITGGSSNVQVTD